MNVYSSRFCCEEDHKLYNITLGGWTDVRTKAKRLRDQGKIHDFNVDKDGALVTARVDGDNGTYDVKLYRTTYPMRKVLLWDCSCPWGKWAFKRQHTLIGRVCSHALAVQYQTYSGDYSKIQGEQSEPFASAEGLG